MQPVKYTSVAAWAARGQGGKYVIKRLKDRNKLLTPPVLARMRAKADAFAGKDYDLYFGWADDKLYCSELVWKVYKQAGIEVGQLHKFRDYDFSNPIVQAKVKERYGNHLPQDENMISPEDIYRSSLLEEVK